MINNYSYMNTESKAQNIAEYENGIFSIYLDRVKTFWGSIYFEVGFLYGSEICEGFTDFESARRFYNSFVDESGAVPFR